MNDETRKAWESGPFGRCLALAREDRQAKQRARLHWSAANFVDDETPDASRVRPTEAQAVTRAFWSCEDAHAVLRDIRAGAPDPRPLHAWRMDGVTLESDWQDMIAQGKLAAAEARRTALEAQMKAWQTAHKRRVPLFDLTEIA